MATNPIFDDNANVANDDKIVVESIVADLMRVKAVGDDDPLAPLDNDSRISNEVKVIEDRYTR